MSGPKFPVPTQSLVTIPIDMARLSRIRTTSSTGTIPSKSGMEEARRASSAGLGCVRGTMMLLMFEAGTALGIYILWQVWRLVR